MTLKSMKMKHLRFLTLMLVVTLLTGDVTGQLLGNKDKEEDPLDSRVFNVEIVEVRNGKEMKAKEGKVSFKYNKVTCKYLKEKTGFANSPYVIMHDSTFINVDDLQERLTHFMGEALDDRGQEFTWKGSVSDNSITAEVTLSKNAVVKKTFIVTGQQKN